MLDTERSFAGSIYDDLERDHVPLTPEMGEKLEAIVRDHFKKMPDEEACRFRPEDYEPLEE